VLFDYRYSYPATDQRICDTGWATNEGEELLRRILECQHFISDASAG